MCFHVSGIKMLKLIFCVECVFLGICRINGFTILVHVKRCAWSLLRFISSVQLSLYYRQRNSVQLNKIIWERIHGKYGWFVIHSMRHKHSVNRRSTLSPSELMNIQKHNMSKTCAHFMFPYISLDTPMYFRPFVSKRCQSSSIVWVGKCTWTSNTAICRWGSLLRAVFCRILLQFSRVVKV